jgi:protoheme IX farnesyltransferase
MIKKYYWLTKPGIIYGNVMTAIAGFLLGAQGDIDFWLLLATIFGTSLVVGSACVFNNYLDRDIDKKMARTKRRALASRTIPVGDALTFGALLGLTGFTILILYTNAVTVAVGATGFFFYIVMYSIWKRRSIFGTLIGSVSGAMPIVAGYTAATGSFDGGAFILFLILVCWQMPHFYSIALYRLEDYKSAGLPVWPVKKGVRSTKRQIIGYIGAFLIAVSLLTAFGYAGFSYLAIMLFFGLAWLDFAFKGLLVKDETSWARRMFGFSLLVILVFSVMLSLDAWLP